MSNIPSKMFYSALGAEFLRISRATFKLEGILFSSGALIQSMLNQGSDVRRVTTHSHERCYDRVLFLKNTMRQSIWYCG